ncbi:MarR family winged helix-turn-helix transcriptional regulator [Streptococcus gallinaceus]|uniref:DNA-binding MarR family transcriptional regulator n=1 Tax=Streptococcus gallinaceus TaxID=165758 RepID=A0ABV2JJE8_9STRE|nr:MarR family winged helix-turn-helix transcriptional regulator [Streptococcus gallinaceus]MCP1638365.1 DNA-binding MarR family transcriptional regulator [Streptococcus gallinaceus]MCP1769548.1 DNA-binding MarR family transcriptional regulator [Streptococcus gallinaceus]
MIIGEIGVIARSLDSIANIEFREMDLAKGQYLYLVRICDYPGIIQEELSEMLTVDRSTVARSVQKLEKSGLVVRQTAAGNRKNKHLYATEKGQQLYQVLQKEHAYSEARCLTGLSPVEVEELERLLTKVRENIVQDWNDVKQGKKRNY